MYRYHFVVAGKPIRTAEAQPPAGKGVPLGWRPEEWVMGVICISACYEFDGFPSRKEYNYKLVYSTAV